MDENNLLKRIIIDPKIMVGKPVVKGTRLTVQHILGLMAHGMSIQEVLDEYSSLKKDDIFACLLFAQHALDSTSFAPLSMFKG